MGGQWTYADHVTKLGPDVMIMDHWADGNGAGKWVNHLKEWEEAARPGGIPPGLREAPVMGAWKSGLWRPQNRIFAKT
jgi:mannosyl-oligosaccharide alpha-1,2-mannosidase